MTIAILATAIRALWFVAEKTHARRHKVTPAGDFDRSSLAIWMAADLTIPLGVIIGFTEIGRIQTESILPGICGIALMLAGICVRWVAIYTLGKFFTRKVTILNDHRVVQSGLYKYLRHPSYSGSCSATWGSGLHSQIGSVSLSSSCRHLRQRCIGYTSKKRLCRRRSGASTSIIAEPPTV